MESHAISSVVDLVSKEHTTSSMKENKSDSLTKSDLEYDKSESSDTTTDCENNDKVSKD